MDQFPIPPDLAPADPNHPLTQDADQLGHGIVAAVGALGVLSLAARIEPGQVAAVQEAMATGLAELRFLVVVRIGSATIEGQLRYPNRDDNPAHDIHREALVKLSYQVPAAH